MQSVVVAAAGILGLSALAGPTLAQSGGEALEQGFRNPPDSARPQ
jgi:hypothetical protein